MSDKIKELLSVLDMSEDEQEQWVYKNILEYETGGIGHHYKGYPIHSLAGLAFRMRDEAVKKYGWQIYNNAQEKVYGYWCKISWNNRKASGETKQHIRKIKFWSMYTQPIHWIISSLIAKEISHE